jgi:hypothetical protein
VRDLKPKEIGGSGAQLSKETGGKPRSVILALCQSSNYAKLDRDGKVGSDRPKISPENDGFDVLESCTPKLFIFLCSLTLAVPGACQQIGPWHENPWHPFHHTNRVGNVIFKSILLQDTTPFASRNDTARMMMIQNRR